MKAHLKRRPHRPTHWETGSSSCFRQNPTTRTLNIGSSGPVQSFAGHDPTATVNRICWQLRLDPDQHPNWSQRLLRFHFYFRRTRLLRRSSDDSKRIYQQLSRFSTFARHPHRNAGNRGQLCHCFAAALKRAVPFAPTQTRSYDLTSTLGAMDAITTVE